MNNQTFDCAINDHNVRYATFALVNSMWNQTLGMQMYSLYPIIKMTKSTFAHVHFCISSPKFKLL